MEEKTKKEDFILLGKYNNFSETSIIESILKSENIPYFIEQESFGKIANITFNGIGEIRIYIHKDYLEIVKELLKKT